MAKLYNIHLIEVKDQKDATRFLKEELLAKK
jgi:hypothetical protein